MPSSSRSFAAITLALATALVGAAPCCASDSTSPVVKRQFVLMGTEVSIEVEARDRATALAASTAMLSALEDTETRLSTWRDDSELSRLNRADSMEWVQLSPPTLNALSAAEDCRLMTSGGFDPAVGKLVDLWELRGDGRWPSDEEILDALPRSEQRAVEIDARGRARRLYEPMRLEEGAFGKGAGARRALQSISPIDGVLAIRLDLGGQVTHWVDPTLDRPRARFDRIAGPGNRHRVLVEVDSPHRTSATSGNGQRSLVVDGRRLGHLLDPRTGRPAQDFGSLTVWADDPLIADCLSTGLYVLGPEAAIARAEAIEGVEALALVTNRGEDLELLSSSGLAGRIRELTDATPETLTSKATPRQPTHETPSTTTSQSTRSDELLPARKSAHRSNNSRPPAH